jgi:hypothetical protein
MGKRGQRVGVFIGEKTLRVLHVVLKSSVRPVLLGRTSDTVYPTIQWL